MTADDDTRRCIVCHRRPLAEHEPQTCGRCVGHVLGNLAAVEGLYPLLEVELRGRIGAAAVGPGDGEGLPFGDLLSLIGPGNAITDRDGQPNDAPSVVAILAGWEDDWRSSRGLPGAPDRATVPNVAAFLREHNGWAASRHPAYDEYAAEVLDLLACIRAALRLVSAPEVARVDGTAVRCIATIEDVTCGATLLRDYADPRPCSHDGPHRRWCDQGGLRDDARSPHCATTYGPAELYLALHEQLATARSASEVA
jgi:hypothetical protein